MNLEMAPILQSGCLIRSARPSEKPTESESLVPTEEKTSERNAANP